MRWTLRAGGQAEFFDALAYTVRCDAGGQLGVALTHGGRTQHIGVEAQAWRFNGTRYWWVCPGCARRSGVLFRPEGAAHWRCRVCHHVTYAASNLSRSEFARAMNRLLRRSQW